MNQDSFNKLTDEIVSKGYDEKTASHFSMLIGDTPMVDKDGDVIVMEDGKILTKLKLGSFKKKADV